MTGSEEGRAVCYWYGEDRSNGYYGSLGVHAYKSYDTLSGRRPLRPWSNLRVARPRPGTDLDGVSRPGIGAAIWLHATT